MSVFFEHTYRDGTSVRFLTKPFEPAKKEVPTIEFNFVQGGALRTLNTRLYDADEKKEFTQEFYDAVGKYLGKDGNAALELAVGVAGATQVVHKELNVGNKTIGQGKAVVYAKNQRTGDSGVIAAEVPPKLPTSTEVIIPVVKPVVLGVDVLGAKKPRKKFTPKKKICSDCGNEYMPKGNAQVRCDDCRRKKKAG